MSPENTYNPMTVSLQRRAKGMEGAWAKGGGLVLVFPKENHRGDLKLKSKSKIKTNNPPPHPQTPNNKAGYLRHEGRP